MKLRRKGYKRNTRRKRLQRGGQVYPNQVVSYTPKTSEYDDPDAVPRIGSHPVNDTSA
jgi:hypothetical protein